MIAVYDTNLSYRLQISVWCICIVIDWWYDLGSRTFRKLPLEVNLYLLRRR